MKSTRQAADLASIAVGAAAVLALIWGFPRAFPLFPTDWQVSREEAEAIALESVAQLGDLPPVPYVVTLLDASPVLEPRLQELEMSAVRTAREIRESRLGGDLLAWETVVYDRGSPSVDWTYRVRISPGGEVSELRTRVPADEPRPELAPARARRLADAFLTRQGFELVDFEEPELRSRQLPSRTDIALRYAARERLLGAPLPDGVEVSFAGDRLTGFAHYLEDPNRAALQRTLQSLTLLQQAWIFAAFALLPLVAIPFVRRYHAGEIGVRRGLELFVVVAGCGIVVLLFCARAAAAGWTIGVLTRPQVTLVVVLQLMVLYYVPLGLITFLSWSVGESLARRDATSRLAAFDALVRGEWLNATFARASLRGLVGGLSLAAALVLLAVALRDWGVWASISFLTGPWWESAAWFSLPLLATALAQALYSGTLGRLLLVSYLERPLGRWPALTVAAVVGAIIFFPLVIVFPVSFSPIFWVVTTGGLVLLFQRFGLWTTILAQMVATLAIKAGGFLVAADPAVQVQAVLGFVVIAAPTAASLRHIWSEREFAYRYEDVPPHVRRIAERERQKVELETARRIQTSILPDLPPELHGIRMAHAYLPASEVGGDFYDVLALEDGRLAVAVGDVAGHGVSSGLVMSMAKSALAVQVTFDPDVESVFRTLNRMVFQSARKRLLATLCYAVVDPARREMFFASAGHLFPYRISARGEVEALESVSYPLGVRSEMRVRVRSARLEPGDFLFLFSDGVVEARRQGSDDLFGFARLERSLRRHSDGSVKALQRGVLEDLEVFTGPGPRDDDLTVLVLQIP